MFSVLVRLPVACRRLLRGGRLLGLRRPSFRTPACPSGVDLADLGAKIDYEQVLAKSEGSCTDEDALVLRLNAEANFPEQRSAKAGPLIIFIAILGQFRVFWVFRVFCESVPRQILLLGLYVIT